MNPSIVNLLLVIPPSIVNPSYKKFSRLYGYRFDYNGAVVQVQFEVEIIEIIFYLLSRGIPTKGVKEILVRSDYRTRSRNLFSETGIENIVRPIYAGLIRGSFGFYIKSKIYPPIVTRKIWKKAQKTILKSKKQSETVSI